MMAYFSSPAAHLTLSLLASVGFLIYFSVQLAKQINPKI